MMWNSYRQFCLYHFLSYSRALFLPQALAHEIPSTWIPFFAPKLIYLKNLAHKVVFRRILHEIFYLSELSLFFQLKSCISFWWPKSQILLDNTLCSQLFNIWIPSWNTQVLKLWTLFSSVLPQLLTQILFIEYSATIYWMNEWMNIIWRIWPILIQFDILLTDSNVYFRSSCGFN